MGYGKVAPAPVRSTDCAEATAERRAAIDKATAMLRTFLITCDSLREVCRGSSSLSHVTSHHTERKGSVTTRSPACCVGNQFLTVRSVTQEDCDGCSDAQSTVGADRTAMSLNQMLHNRQAETRSSCLTRSAAVGAVETLEDPRQMLRRNPAASVADRQRNPVILPDCPDRNSSACTRVPKRVLNKVEEDLL